MPRPVQRELKLLHDWSTVTVNLVQTHLLSAFGGSASLSKLQANFYARNQSPNESILDYSHALIALARKIQDHPDCLSRPDNGFLKQKLCNRVINNNLSRELSRLLTEKPTMSFIDFRNAAIDWLAFENHPNSNNLPEMRSEALNFSSLQKLIENQQVQLDKQSTMLASLSKQMEKLQTSDEPASGNLGNKSKFCNFCRKSGHVKETCFKLKNRKLFCQICKKKGHSTDRCFSKSDSPTNGGPSKTDSK